MDLHREAALAIVVSYSYFKIDPTLFREEGGQARYYAFRLLKRHFVQVPASLLARYAGYTPESSRVIATPSYEEKRKFNFATLDILWSRFEKKLQNLAPRVDNKNHPEIVKSRERLSSNRAAIETLKPVQPDGIFERPVNKLVGVTQVSLSGGFSVNRKRLEDELRQAILNTGGRLADGK